MYQTSTHFKQRLNAFLHHMQTNELLAHAFFEGLDYNVSALLNSAASRQALSITSEEFFDLLNSMALNFKQMDLNQALVHVVKQEANWCEVYGSGTHEN